MPRLWNLLRRRSLDARLDEEAQGHLEMLTADLVRRGLPPEEAAREARRQFGSVSAVRDAHRDERGVPWLEDFFRDARYALRNMASAPLFTLIAVLTLALGIGPNTAIFSLVNAALLRVQPYPDPATLVEPTKMRKGQVGWPVFDSRTYLHFRENARSLGLVAAARDRGSVNLIQGDQVRPSTTIKVSDTYFAALGVLPTLGRNFTRAEDAPGAAPTAILSHAVWQQAFRGDAGILNQTVNLGGLMHTVVGVLPASFPTRTVDFYTTIKARPVGDGDNILVFGRLKPGVTAEQANNELTNLWREVLRQYSREPEKAGDFSLSVQPYLSYEGRNVQKPLLMIFGVVGLVLLIACANLANLLLARAAARTREISLRATLGAGRGRLFRQLVTESVMLSLAGGLVGLALGYGLLRLIVRTSPFGLEEMGVQLDRTVLVFTIGASLATGLLFGIIPAWHGTRIDLAEATKQSGGKASASRGSGRIRWALVFVEVALSAVLLVGAALLVQSFRNLSRVPSGADESNVIAGQMSLQGGKYATTAASELFFRRGLERLTADPRVESAAVTLALPMERGMNTAVLTPGGVAPDQRKFSNWRYITPTYFQVIRAPMLQGRAFTEADHAKAAPVCIISRQFAATYFKDRDPLGQVVENSFETKRTVVGVVADLQNNNLRAVPPPTVYVPAAQTRDEVLKMAHTWFPVSWVVRGRAGTAGMSELLTREIKAVDPLQPFAGFRTIEELRGKALEMDRFLAALLAGFALLAAILAAAGIYGVISYGVTQRTHEIGIRLALGETPSSVVRGVLTGGVIVAIAGAAAGLAGAYALSTMLTAYIFGVKPNDPLTLAGTALFLVAIAGLASLVPALRVGRLDPARALRID